MQLFAEALDDTRAIADPPDEPLAECAPGDEPISDALVEQLFANALHDPFAECSLMEPTRESCVVIAHRVECLPARHDESPASSPAQPHVEPLAKCSPAQPHGEPLAGRSPVNRLAEPVGETLPGNTSREQPFAAPPGECGCATVERACVTAIIDQSPARQPAEPVAGHASWKITHGSSPRSHTSPARRESPVRRRERRHHHRAARAARSHGRKSRRRDQRAQRERRDIEREVRKRAVAVARWLVRVCNLTHREVATQLGIALATLERWVRNWRRGHRRAADRGRPHLRCTREQRRAAIELLHEYGPELSDAELRRRIENAPRNDLVDLAARMRRHLRRHCSLITLEWTRPGAVWALDFTFLDGALIDNHYDRILVVRDIASHMPLKLWPAISESTDLALLVLRDLIACHGAPLVLKLDNGSAFISDAMKQLATDHGIQLLFNPPRTPSYNGSIEAGMGSLKNRLTLEAARHDRPGRPTSDDLEAARIAIAECTASFGEASPSPSTRWHSRAGITAAERAAFLASIAELHAEEASRMAIHPSDRYNPPGRSSVDRLMIGRALQRHGYLNIRRRRITPAIPR